MQPVRNRAPGTAARLDEPNAVPGDAGPVRWPPAHGHAVVLEGRLRAGADRRGDRRTPAARREPYIVGEFVWTAMDYLGESGIGAWSYATPQEAAQAAGIAKMMQQMMSSMGADGKNPFEAMAAANDKPNPIAKLLFAGYPWHAACSGDLDLTGFRKPSSYYRDILWNGGDRVFATVRLPEPEGKKIVAMGWSVYPTLPSWTWPGQEGKPLTVDVYSGAESVRLYLNDKLIGEKPTDAIRHSRPNSKFHMGQGRSRQKVFAEARS